MMKGQETNEGHTVDLQVVHHDYVTDDKESETWSDHDDVDCTDVEDLP